MVETLYAMGQSGAEQGSPIGALLPFLLIFVVMYFLMIRPQQKKQKELKKMLESLQKGDKVVTSGGLIVTVEGFKNEGKIVIARIDQNIKVEVQRANIASVLKSKGETTEGK